MPMQYCAICDRSFSRPQHLVRHNRIHTGETPYKCLSCTDSFKRADMLKRHVIQSHSTDGRPRQETASGSSKRKPTGRKPTPFASPGKDTEETREDGQRLITRQSGGVPLRLEKSEKEECWHNDDSLNLQSSPLPSPSASTSTVIATSPLSFLYPHTINQALHPYPDPITTLPFNPFATAFYVPFTSASLFEPHPLSHPPPLSAGPRPGTVFDPDRLLQFGVVSPLAEFGTFGGGGGGREAGLDWDGGISLSEDLGMLDGNLLSPLPPGAPLTTAFTTSTSAPLSIFPIQLAFNPPSCFNFNTLPFNSSASTYTIPPFASSLSTILTRKDLVRDYASSLYSFNIAILSTLPLTKGTAPAPIEKLHYQSHLQLHVNPHLGTPPLLYTPQIHLGIEEDDHHVEGRLGGNQLQPDFLSVFPMTIFERRSLRKALVEAAIC